MALILSCPRCLQSRTVAAIDTTQPVFCPFCRLELDGSTITSTKAPTASKSRRSPRRWPVMLAIVMFLSAPLAVGTTAIVKGKRHVDGFASQTELSHEVAQPVAALTEAKPSLVVSAAAAESVTMVTRESKTQPPPPPPLIVRHYSVERPAAIDDTPKPKGAPPPKPTHWPIRPPASQQDLLQSLAAAPEIDLDTKDPKERKNAVALLKAVETEKENRHPLLAMASNRADLKGLPFRGENECQLDRDRAKGLGHASLSLRAGMERSTMRYSYSTVASLETYIEKTKVDSSSILAAISQVMQAEPKHGRLVLIDLLSQLDSSESTKALAQRAVFEIDVGVRAAAIQQMQKKKPSDYLPVLLAALRHPWPPAADHAAKALVRLEANDAVVQLIELLDEPDPQAPFTPSKKGAVPMVRELVRVNHLRNCLLCHAPLSAKSIGSRRAAGEFVAAAIPTPGQAVPRSPVVYYAASRSGFVRADVTYLKQDFSVTLPVENADKWPKEQRYDFLVRTRPATWWERVVPPSRDYPQRAAVLATLRALTGTDAGNESDEWRAALNLP